MIRISIDLDEQKCLKHIKVSGHEKHKSGVQAMVCASVTTLVRAVAHAYMKNDECKATVKAAKQGELELWIRAHPQNHMEWAKGITEVLLTGIFDLEAEYPDTIEINR